MHKSKSTHPSVWFVTSTGPNLAASHAHTCKIDKYNKKYIYIYIYIYMYTDV